MNHRTGPQAHLLLAGHHLMAGLVFALLVVICCGVMGSGATRAPAQPAAKPAGPFEVMPAQDSTIYFPLILRSYPTTPTVVINEILYLPDESSPETWVELFNATALPAPLSGWILANDALSVTVALPAWKLPPGGYLVVYAGAGADDPDFGDGGASYHAGLAGPFFASEQDAAALYRGAPDSSTLVDFVAWSETGDYAAGAASGHAVAAGRWAEGAFFAAVDVDSIALTHPVMPGESIGRDRHGGDGDWPGDWASLGGPDAIAPTPGARNESVGRLDFGDEPPPAGAEAAASQRPQSIPTPAPQPHKPWTVMVYLDPRDPAMRNDWESAINQMEEAGSGDNISLVVQIGFQPGYTYRYYITADTNKGAINSPRVVPGNTVPVNPGDPASLSSFIGWARANFPAERYALVLGGHGQGWKGILMSHGRDHLTMAELSAGLAGLGAPFDVIFFYSCLMGQVEVGHQVAARAAHMVASEEQLYTSFSWPTFIRAVNAHPDWDGGTFADWAAQSLADQLKGRKLKRYTVTSVNLTSLTETLAPAIDDLAARLIGDMEDYKAHDIVSDNAQIRVKHDALEQVESFMDENFIDLYHFAELIGKLPLSAVEAAAPLLRALTEGNDRVVRWEGHGSGHPNAHGLTIYFPRNLLLPSAGGDITSPSRRAFDDPRWGTHLYKRDAAILLPALRAAPHAMADDDGFAFPNAVRWDEFLHRYYKPVADACVRKEGQCLSDATFPGGTEVTLSGEGSSDSDGPDEDDVPAHRRGGVQHWYWDFNTAADTGGAAPAYREGVRYVDCDGEDCDRDANDEADDDRDAQGRVVTFNCPKEGGNFDIRLMVWDEHNDQDRKHIEDRKHNGGRHWLHFNVDDDRVKVRCLPALTPTPMRSRTPTSSRSPTFPVTDEPTRTRTPTPTPTPTRTMTPTPTPKKPAVTGITSTFVDRGGGWVEVRIHVLDLSRDATIYDLEFFFAQQDPPWSAATVGELPAGWVPKPVSGGVGGVTPDHPLRACQPITLFLKVEAAKIGDLITIHLTDRNHKNIGNISSGRVPG